MTIGIYCIKNDVNSKIYIGQSTNIENRIRAHERALVESDPLKSRTSKLLYEDGKIYGPDSFSSEILEVCSDDQLLIREKHWIRFYKSNDPVLGYNERLDYLGIDNPNFGNTWSDEQKLRMSNIKTQQHLSGEIYNDEWKEKISKASTELWKDEVKKAGMAKKVGLMKEKYTFTQMTKAGEIVRLWSSMREILAEHPEYHKQSIYSVCSNYKKSYKGFVWSKQPKI